MFRVTAPSTTGADALAAMQALLIRWLGLASTTPATSAPFLDASLQPRGFSFTLLVPTNLALALCNAYAASIAEHSNLGQLQGGASAQVVADALTATATAMSRDGSLASALAARGLASSFGYDSTDSLLEALSVMPAVAR